MFKRAIFLFACIIAMLHSYSQSIGWRDGTGMHKKRHFIMQHFTIGFRTSVLNTSMDKMRPYHMPTQGMHLRSYLNAYIAFEMGMTYNTPIFKFTKGKSVNFPLSVEYFLRSPNYRLRPYFGAGVIYTPYYNATGIPSVGKEGLPPFGPMGKCHPFNMNVSQGVLYQINTKIQVNESIHFFTTPDNCKSIGFDVGIGYCL